MMARVAARLEVLDPGFARTRHGARTACATVLSGLTLAVVTSVFGVAEPLRITLFGAGACFFGALLVTDPHRRDRARTFGWASVVAGVAIAVTVELSRTAVWAARVWNRRTPCGSPTTCTPDSLSSPYFSAVTRGRESQCTSTYPPFGEGHHSVAGDY